MRGISGIHIQQHSLTGERILLRKLLKPLQRLVMQLEGWEMAQIVRRDKSHDLPGGIMLPFVSL